MAYLSLLFYLSFSPLFQKIISFQKLIREYLSNLVQYYFIVYSIYNIEEKYDEK